MKKTNTVRLIIIMVFIFISYNIFSSYIHFKSNQVTHSSSTQLNTYFEDISYEPKYLYQYLDFPWDTVHILGPYLPNSHKHGIVNSIWYTNHSYIGYLIDRHLLYDGEILSDGFQELIFTKEGKVVSTALINRREGDFLHLDQREFNMETARFLIKKDEYSNKRIIPVE